MIVLDNDFISYDDFFFFFFDFIDLFFAIFKNLLQVCLEFVNDFSTLIIYLK